MKKVLFFVLAIAAVALTSCSNEEYVATDPEPPKIESLHNLNGFCELQANIKDLNMVSFGIQQENAQTRGWLGKLFKRFLEFKNIVVIGLSDIITGPIGSGVAVGAVATGLLDNAEVTVGIHFAKVAGNDSTITSKPVNNANVSFSNVMPQNDFLVKAELDSVGMYHNKALFDTFNNTESFEQFKAMPQTEQASFIINEIKKDPELNAYYQNSMEDENVLINKTIYTVNTLIEAAKEAEDEDEFFNKLAEANIMTSDMAGVMEEIIAGLVSLDTDADEGEYYNELLRLVKESEIDDSSKYMLQEYIIVGQASNRLWNREAMGVQQKAEIAE